MNESNWPAVSGEYRVCLNDQGQPSLALELRWDPARLSPPPAEADSFAVETSLVTAPSLPLPESAVDGLRAWLEAPTQLAWEASVPVPLDQVNPAQLFEITAALVMSGPDARSVTPLAPNQGRLREFALDLEAALTASGRYQVKVAQRADQTIWAVRTGLSGDESISYRILNPGAPKVYAPRPISTRTDMDALCRRFLDSMDRVLTTGGAHLTQLLAIKRRVAAAFKQLVIPVLQGVTSSPGELAAARDELERGMLLQLGAAYSASAIVQFQVAVRAEISDPPPRLYGTLTGTDVGLSAPTVSLATTTDDRPQFLTFSLSTERCEAHLEMNLSYQPTHIDQFAFVVPPDPASLGTFQVPLVLRSCPTPPALLSHSGTPSAAAEGADLTELCRWDYGFVYSTGYHSPQDRTYFSVQFGGKDGEPQVLAPTKPDLFDALVEFIAAGPAVEQDLVAYIALAGRVAGALERHISSEPVGAPPARAEGSYEFFIEEPALRVSVVGEPPAGVGRPFVIPDGSITERSVVLPGLNILAWQGARVSAWTVRNQSLLPDPATETAEPFIYRTDEATFPAPLCPCIDSALPVHIAALGAPTIRPLGEHLEALLRLLFVQAPQTALTICLQCAYSYQIAHGMGSVSAPVLRLPPTQVTASQAGDFAGALAGMIAHWFVQTRPQPDGGALTFDLTVFSDLPLQPEPLLRLRNLSLGLSEIDPPLIS